MLQLSENSVSNTVEKGQISPIMQQEKSSILLREGVEFEYFLSSLFTHLVKGGQQRE